MLYIASYVSMHVFCLSPYANHCAFLLSMGKGPWLAMGKVWVEKPFPQLSFFLLLVIMIDIKP